MKYKKMCLKSVLVAALMCANFAGGVAVAVEAGKSAPEFTVAAASSAIHLSDYKGKVVYLDFWASWCGPCRQSFPWMNAMQEKFGSQGFEVVAVNLDEKREDAAEFLKLVPASFQIAYDPKGDVARQYEVKGMPTSVLIDRDGKVIFQHPGFYASSKMKLEQAISTAIGKKP